MVVSAVITGDRNTVGPATGRVDPLGDPFLRTRFAIPSRPATFLPRGRLTRHLAEGLRTPLTMVNGSAGAGKTLLVADWTASLDRPVTWLTVEAEAQRPGMFWAYFLQALSASGTPLSDRVRRPADPGRVSRTMLSEIAEDLVGRDPAPVVVLDEFDRVSASEVAEQLEFVLQHAGSGLRLVLVTRNEPMFSLHRYRAAGTLTEIRDAELAMTPEEAAALLELHGLSLPADAVRALVDRTRGWAAGLRLCALAAQQSPEPEMYLKEFEADHSAVADFLLAEVLRRQPPATQDLLLRASVLDRFCPDLVDGLTHRTDAGPILAELHRDNAFVEQLGQGWYRLHPLFGEILQTHLRVRHPGLEPDLHRSAAQWLRRRGTLPEVLAHGAAAADWDFTAAALVDDLAIGQFFTGLRSAELNELFSRMGPEATGPATELVRAARDLAHSDLDQGVAHLQHAEARLAGEEGEEGDPAAARLSCAFLETLAARLTGSPARAEQAAETADGIRPEVPAHLLAKHPELSALLLTHLGSARLWAGHYEDARAALSEAADCPGGVLTVGPREESLGHLALLDYLDGWPGRAEHKALAALTERERFSLPQPSGCGIARLVLAAVAVDRHELGRAQALLDEAGEQGLDTQDPVEAAGRAIATARLHLARGDACAAMESAAPALSTAVASPWADSLGRLVTSTVQLAEGRSETAAEGVRHLPDGRPAWAVEAARIQLAAGRADEAIDLLDSLAADGRSGPAVTVRAALVRARAAHGAGDSETARRLVAQALVLARSERLRRPFLDAGRWIRPLLVGAPLRPLAAGWLLPAPAPGGGPVAAPRPAPLVVEELSEREHDVLRRLAQMMSTQEIAADLYLSVNTVKTHLKSLYRKLGVNRRSEAVRRARELRLL
ncbi:LuxR family maltose regulon positive regulatory protein [Streptomyces sp. SAI-135]|uniref:LuxR C-terminal-related transcriptional regulator n=1 Tax=unclassified Streptomyces TaxID=2593676 RepID=UPI0024740263|nr:MULTISPECIES: LuxR C-terminal-related transcriptional regulator [unclassified Streptomyces]MDH6515046.1 LuxR family maltose regulon positive regulatory protein [Streptomyces sp. SAI-090]MDH6620870.1 LuxR family maltose regulon positive regulatory protein [Streptomyces sp. SAI-135]